MGDYIFISYSTKDLGIVNQIMRFMEDNQIEYWIAPYMIPTGSNYAREIPTAIKGAAAMLLVLSDNSQRSMWVEKEVDCAINNKTKIIPFNISGTRLGDVFSFYLNNVQAIKYYQDHRKGMESLKQALMDAVGKTEVPQETRKRTSAIEGMSAAQAFRAMNANPAVIRQNDNKKRVLRNEADDFKLIRETLDVSGPLPMDEIAEITGVPKDTIREFIRQERLEIPGGSKAVLVCEQCGSRIRTGYLCDACKRKNLQ